METHLFSKNLSLNPGCRQRLKQSHQLTTTATCTHFVLYKKRPNFCTTHTADPTQDLETV